MDNSKEINSTKKYYWLRLKHDFFQQKEIKRLRKIAGGDTYTVIYLKMLLKSINTGGKLYFDGVEDDFVSELALDIDEDPENVSVTVQFLLKNGILVSNSEEEYFLTTCPEMIGKETAAAGRMRTSRAKKKVLECNNVTPMLQDVTKSYTEKEIEKEIEKDKKEKVKKEKCSADAAPKTSFFEDEEINKAFIDYLEMRKKKRCPTTDRAIALQLENVNRLATTNGRFNKNMAIAVLEQSIINGWTGVFELKKENQYLLKQTKEPEKVVTPEPIPAEETKIDYMAMWDDPHVWDN